MSSTRLDALSLPTPPAIDLTSSLGWARYFQLLLVSMRPRQWVKNAFVFAPLAFTDSLLEFSHVVQATVGALCFCGLCGGTYLINDLLDRHSDVLHPGKRRRPVASGALPPRAAWPAAIGMIAFGMVGAALVNVPFLALACAYTVLMLAYSSHLKNVVLIDVIAAGFVLRVVAGAVAIMKPVPVWLLICTALASLFLALGKRRSELTGLRRRSVRQRRVLNDYTLPLLDRLIAVTAVSCLVCYFLFCVLSETAAQHPWLPLTVPIVGHGLIRYRYQLYRKHRGESPEDILFQDPVLLTNGLAYLMAVLLVIHLT
jgi:4-hydroxybenzoate polyprenyltransferase